MTPQTVRCGNCDYWLGESASPLVFIEHVAKDADVVIGHPRDVRNCKACSRKNVFIPRADLDARRLSAQNRDIVAA